MVDIFIYFLIMKKMHMHTYCAHECFSRFVFSCSAVICAMCWMNCIVVDKSNRNPEALKKALLQLDVAPERRFPRRNRTDQSEVRADVMHEQGQQQARH